MCCLPYNLARTSGVCYFQLLADPLNRHLPETLRIAARTVLRGSFRPLEQQQCFAKSYIIEVYLSFRFISKNYSIY